MDICKINPVKANIFGKKKNGDKNTSIKIKQASNKNFESPCVRASLMKRNLKF